MFMRLSAACRSAVGFWRDRSGQFAVIFALSAIPLFGVAGLALDYSMLRMRMSAYQSAADNAALTAAITVSAKDWTDAKKEGENAFVASLQGDYPDASEGDLTLAYDSKAQTVRAEAESSVSMTLTGILGFKKLDFEVVSVVNLPRYPIEVSLAVDVTDSMREMTSAGKSKIQTLRDVGTEFVANLMSNSAAAVKVSIVPFAMFNKVSRSFLGQPWFRLFSYGAGTVTQCQRPDSELIGARCTFTEVCNDQDGVGGCLSKRKVWSCPAGVPLTRSCTFSDSAWNGCVSLRAEPWRNTDDGYLISPVMGRSDAWCPNDEILPLTNDRTRAVNLMRNLRTQPMMFNDRGQPGIGTYTANGVNWALATLSKHPPYEEAMDDTRFREHKGKRYIILMTDGANTAAPASARSQGEMQLVSNTNSAARNTQIQTAADNNTLKLCDQAKARDITVYTISFGDSLNAKAVEMLKKCATTPDGHYFHARMGAELDSAFSAIEQGILKVYLSQ